MSDETKYGSNQYKEESEKELLDPSATAILQM